MWGAPDAGLVRRSPELLSEKEHGGQFACADSHLGVFVVATSKWLLQIVPAIICACRAMPDQSLP
jgi:hypothetical protein